MIIIFEGPDGAGKDFLRREFERQTLYKHTVVTRFMPSQIVFARYFDRPEWKNPRLRELASFEFGRFMGVFKPLIVYCHAVTPTLHERIRRRGESIVAQPDLDKIKAYYDQLFEECRVPSRILKLDTSYDPPLDDLVSRIKGKVKSLETK